MTAPVGHRSIAQPREPAFWLFAAFVAYGAVVVDDELGLALETQTLSIFGTDVVAQPATVRTMIGLAGQYAAVDELLTGRENLRMVGRLYHLPEADVRVRGEELLDARPGTLLRSGRDTETVSAAAASGR